MTDKVTGSRNPDPAEVARRAVGATWRVESTRIVGSLVRFTGDFALAEDVAQEALAEALVSWARNGVPDRPAAWLLTTARRRAIDFFRRRTGHDERLATLASEAAQEMSDDDLLWDPDRVTLASPEADHTLDIATTLDQALRYRLCGDRNLLHSDPGFARRAGFERPILHGLGSLGIVGRVLVGLVGGGDPTALRSMRCAFSGPLYPGETMRLEVWRASDADWNFRVIAGDRRVLDRGEVRFT